MGQTHGDASHAVATPLDFPCMQANADIDAELTGSIADRNRPLHGPDGPIEHGENAIAHPLECLADEDARKRRRLREQERRADKMKNSRLGHMLASGTDAFGLGKNNCGGVTFGAMSIVIQPL